jgi:hypothetical protein
MARIRNRHDNSVMFTRFAVMTKERPKLRHLCLGGCGKYLWEKGLCEGCKAKVKPVHEMVFLVDLE